MYFANFTELGYVSFNKLHQCIVILSQTFDSYLMMHLLFCLLKWVFLKIHRHLFQVIYIYKLVLWKRGRAYQWFIYKKQQSVMYSLQIYLQCSKMILRDYRSLHKFLDFCCEFKARQYYMVSTSRNTITYCSSWWTEMFFS